MLSMFNNKYPYTDFHELNLDWILAQIKELTEEMQNFIELNANIIKYADPIQWDITAQYEQYTIVEDGNIAYLSKVPVAAGIAITDTDYWLPVFDLSPIIGNISNIRDQISANYETSYTATANYNVGDWLFVLDSGNDLLYYVTAAIAINGGIVPGVNVQKVTVEDLVKMVIAEIANVRTDMGDLADLTTTDQTSLVNAINEVDAEADANTTNMGDLATLITTDQTSLVNAINEVKTDAGNNAGDITNILNTIGDMTSLTTPATSDIVVALNSLQTEIDNQTSGIYINVKDYGATGDGVTDDTAAINDALAEAQTYNLGATLFFPAGEYLISSTISIPYVSGHGLGGISILGEGSYSSVIFSNSDIDLIEYVGDGSDPQDSYNLFGIYVQNIYLRYTGGNSTKTGINFTYCHQVLMSNVKIRYFKTAVYLDNCPNSVFFKVAMSANSTGARGFDVGNHCVSNVYIGCFFGASGSASGNLADSSGFYATRGTIADQSIFYFDVGGGPTYAIYIDGSQNTLTQTGDINIYDLVCESHFGIALYHMNRHGNVNIIGGWFNCLASPGRQGVYISDSKGVSVNGAKFVNNIGSGTPTKTAVYIADVCENISITNCTILNQNGLSANSAGDNLMFANNIVAFESGVTGNGSMAASGFTHTMFTNNIFRGVTLRYMRLLSTAVNSIMSYNITDGQGTATSPDAPIYNQAGGSCIVGNNIEA